LSQRGYYVPNPSYLIGQNNVGQNDLSDKIFVNLTNFVTFVR